MKNNKTVLLVAISILSLIIISFSAYIFIGSYNSEITPNKTENDYAASKVVLPGDEEKIYQSISGTSSDSVKLIPDITHSQVKEMLSHISAPESFCWYYSHTLYSSKKSSTSSGILKMDHGSYRIEAYGSDGTLTKTVVGEGESISVVNNIYSTVSEFPSSSTSVFVEANVPDIQRFISDEGLDFEYTLVNSDYGTLIFAEFYSSKDGYSQREEYYISLDYGIVIKADCYENDTIIYALATTALYEL